MIRFLGTALLFSILTIGCSPLKQGYGQKKLSESGAANAESLARDGLAGYLLVPLQDNKYEIATNFALCGVLMEGSFDGQECAEAINKFYKSEATLRIDQIADAHYFEIVDIELINLYSQKGAKAIINEMYDKNCIPKGNSVLSHTSTKAAALINLGVSLVQSQYHDFEISQSACEKYQ